MDVSIIIINYNTYQLTCNCIRSVIEKTNGLTYEILLVDNASTECDPDLFSSEFPMIRLIKSRSNVGFAKGNNLGIQDATGNYILLLNSDTELINNAVKLTYDFLSEHHEYAVVSSQLQFPDGTLQHAAQRFPSLTLEFIERLRLHKFLPKTYWGKRRLGSYAPLNEELDCDWVWGTFFMFPASMLKKLENQKLADNFFMYIEDMQWCFEFKALGKKVKYLPSAKVLHLMGASNGEKNLLMIRNFHFFTKKYYNPIKSKILNLIYN